ncbi:MAG: fibronectin type III domain-containing protein, partial [Gammaproteobacteria bacterium]|nr:fibronectin type III domain-containing protein [Gammaproteobacteria bacterium]
LGLPGPLAFLIAACRPPLGRRGGSAAALVLLALAAIVPAGPARAQSVNDLTATANGPTQIDLAWTAPNLGGGFSADGYEIEVSTTGADGTWTTLVSDTGSAATKYSHTGLTAGTTRYYRLSGMYVRAISDEAAILSSNVASATTDAATEVPDAPTGLTATAKGQTRIDLAWTAPSDAAAAAVTGYRIEVSPSGNAGTWTNLVADTGGTGTTYSHTGLQPDTARHYRVSAINSVGTSEPSTEASATTSPLVAPTGLTATVKGQTRIDLAWTAPDVAAADAPTGYKVEVSLTGA